MARALDLDNAVSTCWSMLPAAVTGDELVAAWSAAADRVWKDELYVEPEDGAVRAEFLFNSGHVRMTVCSCALLVPAGTGPASHALTVVTEAAFGLNLGWALHTHMLETVTPGDWFNPTFGEQAVRKWRTFSSY